ncbi:hypothetical protein BIW11_02717, partial [Tropilaelaps mercedesae]
MSWQVIYEALGVAGVSEPLRHIIASYLSERVVNWEESTFPTTAGVARSSLLGPTLWMPLIRSVAYADGLVLFAKGHTKDEIDKNIDRKAPMEKWQRQWTTPKVNNRDKIPGIRHLIPG